MDKPPLPRSSVPSYPVQSRARDAARYVSATKSLLNQVHDLKGLEVWNRSGLGTVGSTKLVMTKARVLEASLTAAAILVQNPHEARRAKAMAKTLSAGVSCGSTLVFGVLTFGTGVGAVVTGFKLAGCVKGVIDAADAWNRFQSQDEEFQGIFETSLNMQWVGLGLDTAGLVGDLVGGAAERGIKLAITATGRRATTLSSSITVARASLQKPWIGQQLAAGSWSRAQILGSVKAAKALTAFQVSMLGVRSTDLVVRTFDHGWDHAATAGGRWLERELGPHLRGSQFLGRDFSH